MQKIQKNTFLYQSPYFRSMFPLYESAQVQQRKKRKSKNSNSFKYCGKMLTDGRSVCKNDQDKNNYVTIRIFCATTTILPIDQALTNSVRVNSKFSGTFIVVI